MNQKYRRIAERLESLIAEGSRVAALERPSSVGSYIQDPIPLNAWLVKVDNLVRSVFGSTSAHYEQFKRHADRHIERSSQVNAVVGVLTGALDDLEGGFLEGQERLVAGVIFDSVLEEARTLARAGFKDPAAVLGRVVLEDALRRLCRNRGLDDTVRASMMNDALKTAGHYAQPQWRLIQTYLDIGNSAAHGKFDDYDEATVLRMIDDIDRFWAQELS